MYERFLGILVGWLQPRPLPFVAPKSMKAVACFWNLGGARAAGIMWRKAFVPVAALNSPHANQGSPANLVGFLPHKIFPVVPKPFQTNKEPESHNTVIA